MADSAPVPVAVASPSPPSDIHAVLEHWTAGRKDEAVQALVALYQSGAPPKDYRPYQLTEQQFVALPTAEQAARRDEMVATFEKLNKFVHEVRRRAQEAAAAGDPARAETLYRAIKALGAANMGSGSEVTALADVCGKSWAKWADAGLEALVKDRDPTFPHSQRLE